MLKERRVKELYVCSFIGVSFGIRAAVQRDESVAHKLFFKVSRLQCVSSRPAPDGVILGSLPPAQIIVLSAQVDACCATA